MRYQRSLCVFLLVGLVLSACGEGSTTSQSSQVEPPSATRSVSLTPDAPSPTVSRTALPSYTPRPSQTPSQTPQVIDTPEGYDYNQIAACQFDPNAAPAQASSQDIDSFQFSEPRFVYERESLYTVMQIGEWIPTTNQISFQIYNGEKTFIGTVDSKTKVLTNYMDAELIFGLPTWIPTLGGVAFGTRQATAPYTGTLLLYTSPIQALEVISQDAFSFQWNADRTGMLIQDVQSQKRPVIRSLSADNPPAVTLHLNRIAETLDWRLPPTVQLFFDQEIRVDADWGGPQDQFLALISKQGLFIADLVEDRICRLGYEGESWPMGAQWSPDGRFLAVGIAPLAEPPFSPVFEVIDVLTGERIQTPFSNLFVSDLSWSADSSLLLISARDSTITSEQPHKLMLVDLVRQKRRLMQENPPFVTAGGDNNYDSSGLRWSADGKQIAFFGHRLPASNAKSSLPENSGIYVIDVK
jgi:hypothetical protein